MEVTLTLANSNSNLLNNISQIPLPPQVPGQRPAMFSGVHLDYPPQYVPQEGKKSLSATTLQEREKTPCPHTLLERVRTPCFLSPQEGERTPHFHTPQEGVKTPCSHTPREGVKTPRSHAPQEGVKTPSVQSHIVFIQDQVQKENNLKVGSRLKLFLPVWKNLGAHHSIQNLIAEGYKLPFRERPKLSRTPCIISGFSDLNKQSALSTAIQDLIRKGAIDIVQKPDSLGFYSRLFLVPKPGNRWRPVIDLSCLNKFLAISKFTMETPESIRASLRKNEWVTSIDLTDAYLHIPIHPHSQKYLRFHHKGVSYQFTSLPFGLATAPLTFTNVVKEVRLLALQRGIRIHQYLDDWLVRAPSKEECHKQTQKLLNLIRDLGFIVNFKKSELVPSQRFDFLGYHFLLDLGLVKPTQDRWTKLQDMFRRLSSKSVISARTLMSTIGLLASMEKTVKLGRMHMRPFQWHLKTHWKYPMPLDTPIPWNQKMIRHGEWWLDPKNVLLGEFLHPREHEKLIFTDASNAGWGAHLDHDSTGGVWSHIESHLHINLLELKAVLLALQFFKTTCKNNRVLIASDNTSIVSYINKQGGTKSAELCALMWRILTWCNLNNVTLRARHIPGSLNVIADGLSRRNQIQSTEWSLSPQVFKQISRIWESPQVDLFATRLNTKLPLYVSPIPDPQAWAVDALNIPWENLVAYAFPPTALLPKVIQKLQSQMCRLLLIAPGWPSKPWFWDLVEMSLDVPRRLPQTRTLLKQPMNNIFHSNPASLNLHVWYLGAQRCNKEGSLQKWQTELLLLKDSTRAIYTSKWSVFQRWCMEQQVDFGSPSIGDICNFFWYLFHDLNRCPSTIEGYRTAIADTLGNSDLNIGSNTDIARLIASFYRDKPKKSRPLPKWDLALVLHKLTQPPFEPQEECTLKLTTWKTVFSISSGLGKEAQRNPRLDS